MGNFIGLKISNEDIINIKSLQKDINLKNCVKEESLHCSLFATKNEINYIAKDYDIPIVIDKLSLQKMKTQKGVDCLVIAFDNEKLQNIYNEIKENYNVKSIYPTLKLHLTISYDCGDIEIEGIDLSKYIKEIKMIGEYVEELNFQKPYEKS